MENTTSMRQVQFKAEDWGQMFLLRRSTFFSLRGAEESPVSFFSLRGCTVMCNSLQLFCIVAREHSEFPPLTQTSWLGPTSLSLFPSVKWGLHLRRCRLPDCTRSDLNSVLKDLHNAAGVCASVYEYKTFFSNQQTSRAGLWVKNKLIFSSHMKEFNDWTVSQSENIVNLHFN